MSMNSELGYMDRQEEQSNTRTGRNIAPPQPENWTHKQISSLQKLFNPSVFKDLITPDDIIQPEIQPEVEPEVQTEVQSDLQPVIHPDEGVSAPASLINNGVDTFGQEAGLNTRDPSSALFQRTSQVIHLTLSLDMFVASEVPTQASFFYFTEEVDSPFLSPFDHLNWRRIKMFIAQLGAKEVSVAKSIMAIQALYRAQVDRLSTAHAMSLYQAAITSFKSILGNDIIDFHIILIYTFLLCLFELTLPNQDSPTFNGSDAVFLERLEGWLLNDPQSPVALRICTWLQLLDTAAKRGGSPSLLPDPVFNSLSNHISEAPSLSPLNYDIDPGNALYDTISAPFFTFYLKLQRISNQVADVSHYRRSRTTVADQAEVNDILTGLKDNIYSLWETRPGPLRLVPRELREHFHYAIADPLVSLTGVYLAAYFAEFIVIGRTLGDPPFPSAEAREAMKQIRIIIEGDWNSFSGEVLNPGYLRPLFLYGIESFEKEETQWAADRLRQIRNPICRSTFFASFIESHGEAQRSQRRRVTMKYFCYQTFGVPLPFM
ncbi:hypothetical protein VE00_09318 [Pseudogymnoascus sp. WSF 3629]|nr:hypothetical protein VE00_09318 [Pseudogymnoascus sp. WSF 3629]